MNNTFKVCFGLAFLISFNGHAARAPKPPKPVNQPPTIQITSPSNGSSLPSDGKIIIRAQAQDDLKVKQVEFLVNGKVLCKDKNAPYECSLTLPKNMDAIITAKASDSKGLSTTTPKIVLSAQAINQPPTIQITSPLNGSKLPSDGKIIVLAEAQDDVKVEIVEFLVNDKVLCQDKTIPYECSLTLPKHMDVILTARALDSQGLSKTTPKLVVTKFSEPPVVVNPPTTEAGTCSLVGKEIAVNPLVTLTANGMPIKTWVDKNVQHLQSDGSFLFSFNGTNSQYVDFPSDGYYVFNVQAKHYSTFSSQSENPYPKLQVSVNGRVVSEADVNSQGLEWYNSNSSDHEVEAFKIPAGRHLVSISAGNWSKEVGKSNYQNLFVREMKIFKANHTCADSPTVPDLSQKSPADAPLDRELALGTVLDTGICIQGLCLNVFKDDPKYHSILKKFNHMTPGSAFLMDRIAVREGVLDFSQADEVVNFAVQNNMSITFGHLVWHHFIPQWLINKNNPTYTKTFLKNYITTVMTRYKGKIKHWVVVNEALDDYEGSRNSFWKQQYGGDSYIAEAFKTARAADPDANLMYNDYDIDEIGRKSDAAYELLSDLKASGVPVDVIGLQAHLKTDLPLFLKSMIKNMERFADLGLKIQLTEVDVGFSSSAKPTTLALDIQAQYYRNTLKACMKVQECELYTVFGTADKYWWGPLLTPPLFYGSIMNDDYSAKPGYISLLEILYGYDK